MRFDEFFRALHGCDPFPWQVRLAQLVIDRGWPGVIALPTAAGKTACMDVALFALATEGHQIAAPRRQPRRILFVVDRRLVVDEAFERALLIARSLEAARAGVLREVADRLRELAGPGATPLEVALLRGGVYRDDRWTRSPTQPVVAVSTVDQVGSRLLFRGYGVSPFARSIHAGLLGNDALYIIDEAHCAQPFVQTLRWIERYRREPWASTPLDAPFAVTKLSATPHESGDVFLPDGKDRAHPVLGPRLAAKKPTRLIVAKARDDGFVTTLVNAAASLTSGRRAVGVVVNRVATARLVLHALEELKGRGKLDADVVLLTGRARPIERDELVASILPRIAASPSGHGPADRPLIVVATQCIEVGANLDFDALVTECCPLDSLRQRFGRLNRLGQLKSAPGLVVIRREQAPTASDDGSDDDPVYGGALGRTWRWLREHLTDEGEEATLDLGYQAVERLLPKDPVERVALLATLSAPTADAPVLLPAHVDSLVQTWPTPQADPAPEVFLHGPQRSSADVSLVWRADLDSTSEWAETVSACAPRTGEALPVPIHEVRAWLLGRATAPSSDIESEPETEPIDKPTKAMNDAALALPVLRWCGPDSDRTITVEDPQELRPGDVIVVPSSYGGCDSFGWAPSRVAQRGNPGPSVRDIGEQALARSRRARLRLVPSVVTQWPLAPSLAAELNRVALEVEADDFDARLDNALDRVASEAATTWLGAVASHLRRDGRRRIERHPSGVGIVVSSARLMPGRADVDDFADEDSTSTDCGCEVGLNDHLDHVRDAAQRLASGSGLGPDHIEDCVLAAEFHDLGKADPRLQLWLHGGSRLRAARARQLLAKSAATPTSPAALKRAREAAGYPAGLRHELLSVRLVEKAPEFLRASRDSDLVLHLIASHHGRCRPFAPSVDDAAPVRAEVTRRGVRVAADSNTGLEHLDSGVVMRFWTLVRRYGWWGLSWLEAVVRLADHQASQAEQERA